MKNVSPHLVLFKPLPPRTESDCEAGALRLLRSWKRAWERQAILTHRNDAQGIENHAQAEQVSRCRRCVSSAAVPFRSDE